VTEPLFVPTEAGARDVRRRARRRRRRQMALAAAAVAAIAIGGSLLALPGVGRGADRLSVVPTAPSPGASTVRPVAGPEASGRSVAPSPGQESGSTVGRPAATSPSLLTGPATVDSPTPTAPARRHSASAPITRTTVAFTSQCDATNDITGWCEVYTGPAGARRKHPVSLSMELCRLPVAGDGQITFDDTREVDLEVDSPAGSKDWLAGQGLRNTQHPHTVTVRGGTCLHWAATWDTIGSDGFYAPPGDYAIGYGLDSSQMSQFTSQSGFQVTD